MEEKALDLDRLAELIRSMLACLDPDELSRIYPLLETGMLQHTILKAIGVDTDGLSESERASITALLRRSLREILEERNN